MKRTLAPLLLTLAVLPRAEAQATLSDDARAGLPAGAPPGIELIDAAALLEHASFLASEELGGRLTGSPGQLAAARYIAARFEALGLEPLGDAGEDGQRGWYQRYPVTLRSLAADGTALLLGGEEVRSGFSVLSDRDHTDVDVSGRLVLVERRGETPDLTGCIPVVVLKTPKLRSTDINLAFSSSLSAFMRSRGMARRLQKKGARAVRPPQHMPPGTHPPPVGDRAPGCRCVASDRTTSDTPSGR